MEKIEKDIAIYLRLSMADGDLGKNNKNESNSIENQRQLLHAFLEERDFFDGNVREYVDDGYTGTNFDRPGFQRMLADAGKGQIGVILVKDLSRLGRDYIGVGDYIEQIFPMMGVRLISVNNNFDSGPDGTASIGIDMELNSLVNEMYSRDLSKKVRSSMEVKWKQGIGTCKRVPFGYLWDRETKSRWVIDPVASQYVRMVFDAAIEGCNTTQIAARMNEKKIPTPGAYAMQNHLAVNRILPEDEMLWKATIVRSILQKYEYTGALVMRSRRKLAFGSRHYRNVPMEERVISEDAHEAIVTPEEFDEAQEVIRTMHSTKRRIKDFPLKGVIRCGNCRRMLTFEERPDENVFLCGHRRSAGSYSKCYCGCYSEPVVNARVAYAIRQMTGMAKFLDDTVKIQQIDHTLKLEFADTEKMRSEVEILKAESIRQYEAYADRVINRATYIQKKKEIAVKIQNLKEQIQRSECVLQEQEDDLKEVKEAADAYDKVLQDDSGSSEAVSRDADLRKLVESFVENVYLYDQNHMEIVFKCEDAGAAVLKRCADNTEDGVLDYPYDINGNLMRA